MLEKAFHGSKAYWAWIIFLFIIIGIGVAAYANQFVNGLGVTGMSRDVSWGLYIAQFAFFVGVAASGVMVAIPYYLHNYKVFGKVVIFGEFLAVAAVLMAILFVVVDLGQPVRIMNVILFATPHAMIFWDMVVLSSYLLLNILIGWGALSAERRGFPPAKWVKVLSYIAIPFAISIHTVTAFLFCGLPGRDYWETAILAGRFLSSAFASGPALLILICFIMRRVSTFRVSDKAIDSLSKIVCYAMIINVFFFLCEVFTSFYSASPAHMLPIAYLFGGVEGATNLFVPMIIATICAFGGIAFLIFPQLRKNHKTLIVGLIAVFVACWIDKGIALVLAGFVPNSFEQVIQYFPTFNEVLVIMGVYGIGALVLTVLYKITIDVRQSLNQAPNDLYNENVQGDANAAVKAATS